MRACGIVRAANSRPRGAPGALPGSGQRPQAREGDHGGGGGGECFAAWTAGYLHAPDTVGIDVLNADVVVRTSAGSLMGSTLTGGRLRRLAARFDLFAHFPPFLEKSAHQVPPTASQQYEPVSGWTALGLPRSVPPGTDAGGA